MAFQICDLENLGQGHKYNIHNDAIRQEIQKSINAISRIFALALTVSTILTFHFYLQN